MRIIVAGGMSQPILLDTNKATALLISTDDGKPNVIFKMIQDGKGWIRLVAGEDANFYSVAKELGLE